MTEEVLPATPEVPAVPRPSASVILVRDGPAGVETFMVRRHERSRVAPRAFVFPGGTVRSDDSAFSSATLASALTDRSDSSLSEPDARAYYVAALRELFEEAGVLLAYDSSANLLAVDESDTALQERLAAARLAMQAHELSLSELLEQHAWQPAFDALVPFSHWVTPTMLAARFDTRFFVAEMPPRQNALHCTIETSEGIWLTPRDLLSGDYPVVYATAQHLKRLAPFQTVAALREFALSKPIRCVQPEVHAAGSGLSVHLPPDIENAW
jgi:8-oxo-dGTP pyrophosphatase MutT (NUDIX family)